MATNLSSLAETALEIVFGNDGARLAANTAAADGEVMLEDELLSVRDRRMLVIGALAGAAVAVHRSEHPFVAPTRCVEAADEVLEELSPRFGIENQEAVA